MLLLHPQLDVKNHCLFEPPRAWPHLRCSAHGAALCSALKQALVLLSLMGLGEAAQGVLRVEKLLPLTAWHQRKQQQLLV